jgi:hypothetical protein
VFIIRGTKIGVRVRNYENSTPIGLGLYRRNAPLFRLDNTMSNTCGVQVNECHHPKIESGSYWSHRAELEGRHEECLFPNGLRVRETWQSTSSPVFFN